MKLIDADALREHMYYEAFETDSGLQKWESGLWIRYQMFESILNTEITVEAEPVRHGRWILIERREPQYDIAGVKTWGIAYRCSECGFEHSVIEDFGHYTFCPNCGAKMDEVEE